MHLTQDTSRIGTARVQKKEEADTRIAKEKVKSGKNECGHKAKLYIALKAQLKCSIGSATSTAIDHN